jgi:hypothetical protein
MRKSRLQVASALLGAIPIMTGIIGMFGISDPLYASAALPPSTLLDSNLRFFSGVWLGLGVAMYWIIPTIEKQTLLFRALWGMIFHWRNWPADFNADGGTATRTLHWVHRARDCGCSAPRTLAITSVEMKDG